MQSTAATKVAVSGSFARALRALASVVKRHAKSDTRAVTASWFDKGPPVRFDEYHLETLKPYCESEEV